MVTIVLPTTEGLTVRAGQETEESLHSHSLHLPTIAIRGAVPCQMSYEVILLRGPMDGPSHPIPGPVTRSDRNLAAV